MYLSLGIVASAPTRYSSEMGSAAPSYRPRAPEQGALHTVVRTHLEAFLRAAAERTDGAGLPRFVQDEFRDFLTCGVLEHGFARLRCEGCGLDHLLPFSCLDLLARLAALVPRPRVNLIFYHGVLAPHARLRAAVVSYGAEPAAEPPPAASVATAPDAPSASGPTSPPRRRGWTWAQFQRRRARRLGVRDGRSGSL